jgi:hypothetical protein
MGQTDLQIAAAGWLAQHALFASLVARFGPERVRTLDSETLVASPPAAIAALAGLFRLPLDAPAIAEIAGGPAFSRHSKFDKPFDARDRRAEHRDATELHRDEIEKVAVWAETVAASAGIAMQLDAPLLPY